MAGSSIRGRLLRAFADPVLEPPLAVARTAAVAIILLERDGELEVLLIERARRDGDPWSGHMALPGGHAEPADADLAATAERETREEVGIDLGLVGERLGRLSDSAPVRGMSLAVRPFVFLLQRAPELVLSDEVTEALWTPIAPLHRGESATTHALTHAGRELLFPAWDVGGHVVWGLTYRVLNEFFRRFNAVSVLDGAALDNSHQPR